MARAIWKGPFVEESLIKKVDKEKNNPNKKEKLSLKKKSEISEEIVDRIVNQIN